MYDDSREEQKSLSGHECGLVGGLREGMARTVLREPSKYYLGYLGNEMTTCWVAGQALLDSTGIEKDRSRRIECRHPYKKQTRDQHQYQHESSIVMKLNPQDHNQTSHPPCRTVDHEIVAQ